mgnify:CR=1 FL=1|tara:strand:+ start:4453 stop:4695 length:243 start_codon:yes stop_codon:yes gene_type:complete
MTGELKTIHSKDYKGDAIVYYEMDIKFQAPYNNYTYFSLEGETKQGFVERIWYEMKKTYNATEFLFNDQETQERRGFMVA